MHNLSNYLCNMGRRKEALDNIEVPTGKHPRDEHARMSGTLVRFVDSMSVYGALVLL